jgi:hypothetical protein
MRCPSWLLITSISASLCAAEPRVSPFLGVTIETYSGWANCYTLKAGASSVKAVLVPAVGGRIAHYSLNGVNILFENAASAGKTLANTTTNFAPGGYQCDIGPELRGIPRHQKLWLGPWQAQDFRDYAVRLTSEQEIAVGVELEKEIVMDGETGDLGINQRMKNISDREIAFCLWDRTVCQGGGFAFFPLNKKSRFPAKWSLKSKHEEKSFYDGDKPSSRKVKILDGVLVAQCEGESTKVGADSDAGWIAYAKGKLLFVKYFPYSPKGNYTDGGNSVELYFDTLPTGESRAELEPLSPELRLLPFERYDFPEKWTLIELEEEIFTHEQARALVKKIPKSPFKNK